MLDKTQMPSMGFAVVFGALLGMTGLTLLAWYSGFLNWDEAGNVRSASVSVSPGMDILNGYQCRKGETKQIILGGIEDNFDSAGNEKITNHDRRNVFSERHSKAGSMTVTRSYDDAGVDNILFDHFDLPSKTTHGVVVTKLKSLSSLQNDGLYLGDVGNNRNFSHIYSLPLASLPEIPEWQQGDDIIYASLVDLEFPPRQSTEGGFLPQNSTNLLEYIQAGEHQAAVDLYVGDDTMVDFIGFALCLEPREQKGNSFHVSSQNLPEGFVRLSCEDEGGLNQCNNYEGDTLCEKSLPITCFNDQFENRPDVLDNDFQAFAWSGGSVKFSTPIPGNNFSTQDDVHEFCRAQFGQGWRAATTHEGANSNNFIARGTLPKTKSVWIDTKMQPYANCWKLRPDYDEVNGQ